MVNVFRGFVADSEARHSMRYVRKVSLYLVHGAHHKNAIHLGAFEFIAIYYIPLSKLSEIWLRMENLTIWKTVKESYTSVQILPLSRALPVLGIQSISL